MTGNQFKRGDTVRLKSGGPLMTVTQVSTDERTLVWVAWFDRDEKPQDASYPADALQADSDEIIV